MKINQQTQFKTSFRAYDPSYMELRTGANGDMFDCTWQPDNVSFTDDGLTLKIDKDQDGYTGGEWRTREYFHYGRYQVRMKAIKNTGVVTSFLPILDQQMVQNGMKSILNFLEKIRQKFNSIILLMALAIMNIFMT